MKRILILLLIMIFHSSYLFSQDEDRPILAVMEFDLAAGKGSGQLGTGLSDMLTNALVESGKFRVVERKRIEEIIQEQDLGAEGFLDQNQSASLGKIIGANFLVMGTVTEFKENESGGAAGALLGSVVAGMSVYKSHIGFTIRIVNATTGEILVSKSIDKKVKKVGVAAGGLLGIPAGAVGYKSKAMQDAMEQAIRTAVVLIGKEVSDLEYNVVQVNRYVEIVANNADFMKLKKISDHIESINGVSNLQKRLSDNVGHLYFNYEGEIDNIAEKLISDQSVPIDITGFSESKLELVMR